MREWSIILSFFLLLAGFIYAGASLREARAELGYCVDLLDPSVTSVPVK